MSVDETFNLSFYEVYLLSERNIKRNEEEKLRQENEWVRTSALMSLHANLNRDSTKKPTPFTPEDFYIPSWKKDEKKLEEDTRTDEEILSRFPKKFKEING